MGTNQILYGMIITCLSLLTCIILARPLKYIFRFLLSGLMGVAVLALLNGVLSPFHAAIGINLLTFSWIGVLGLPGFASLIVICIIL